MKKTIIFLILFTLGFSNSQINQLLNHDQINNIDFTKKVKNNTKYNSYKMSNGALIKVGDELIIGKPGIDHKQYNEYTGNRAVFSSIFQGKPTMAALTGILYLDARWQGKKAIVKEIIANHTKMSKKSPLRVSLFIVIPEMPNLGNKYTVTDFESSVEMGEILILNAPMTREEAIAKLKESKDLLELEIISQKEYDALKQELTPIIRSK